jgi:hypothetical protein
MSNELDHPCKATCSGYQQGYEAGAKEWEEKCKRLLEAINKIEEQIFNVLTSNDLVSVYFAREIIAEALKEATSAEGET